MSLEDFSLPSIPEAEQALLGAIFYDNTIIDKFIDYLKPEHFFIPLHEKIYDVCIKIIGRGQVADPIVLKNYLEDLNSFKEAGGDEYLKKLISKFISISQAEEYAKQIYDAFLRREIIKIADDSIKNARKYELPSNAEQQIENIESKLFNISSKKSLKGLQSFADSIISTIKIAELAFKRDSHVVGTTTGFIDLDKLLGGLHPSDLVILAARPSMGKTALATNIAFNAASKAERDEVVLFFSIEMSSDQLTLRLLSQVSKISSDAVRRGALSEQDFISFAEASKKLYDLPLFIDDSAGLQLASLRSKVRRMSRKNKISLIVIDYIQLMISDGWKENRVQQLSEISRGLKAIAKEFNTPILALSQLSRAVEQREDKRPQLADLRESGSIEQDADVVMFVYREEYYQSRKKPDEGSPEFLEWQDKMQHIYNIAEVIVAKQRHGPIDKINLRYEAKFTKFDNYVASEE